MLIPLLDLENLTDETFDATLELAWLSLPEADRAKLDREGFMFGFALGIRTMAHSYALAGKRQDSQETQEAHAPTR